MNTHRSSYSPLFVMLTAVVLLVSACVPASTGTSPQSTEMPEAPDTVSPVQSTQPSDEEPVDIFLDHSALAQNVIVETVAAQPASAGGPYWETAPEYRSLTFEGYPVVEHLFKPQIFVYPASELASVNEAAAKVITDLQTLLQTRQTGDTLPFLPLSNTVQAMHAQMQYLDLKSGKGIRYLTQFNQGISPINNSGLIYTFQGLTSDGKYYISAVLPVTHPDLPAGAELNEVQSKEPNDFQAYLAETVTLLDQQPGEGFSPDLNKLDAMIRSIEVK